MTKVQVLVRRQVRKRDIRQIVREVVLLTKGVNIEVRPTVGDFDFRLVIEAPSDNDLNFALKKMKESGVETGSTFASAD